MSSSNITSLASSTAINVTPLIAPILVGHSLNWLGFGALIVQCYVYYDSFPHDRFFIRLLVYGLLVLEVVQTATTTHQTWWYTVTNWDKPGALVLFPWSAMTVPTIDGLIAFFVQAFYSWRIWTLAQSRMMKNVAVLISVMALASGLVAIITASYFGAHSSRTLLNQLHPAFATWLATSLAADILVAVSMSWILYHAKANTIWPESETMITKLINHAIGTGIAVAVCGLITLVLFVTSPEDSLQYLSGAYLLGKLYSNSVMVTLNARRSIRRNIIRTSSHERVEPDTVSLSFRVPPTTVRTGAEGETSISGISTQLSQDPTKMKRPEKTPAYYDAGDVSVVKLRSATEGEQVVVEETLPSDTSHL